MAAPTAAPGRLGAIPDSAGVDFTLSSGGATGVELCLFDAEGRETDRVALAREPGDLWRARVAGIGPGQLYGYRAHGPWRPREGLRFNPHKLLLDPYARRLAGRIRWDDATYAWRAGDPEADLSFDARDSAPFVPRCVVTAPEPPAPDDRPRRPWRETVLYEAHVKGLTRLHPDIPAEQRGTFAALGHPALLAHLERLGITALQLLPIQLFADDRFLVERALSNYWGYSTVNFFAPEPRYEGAAGPDGLRQAIGALHAAGIEVILDVVLNHTAEADHLGPTLSYRGIDNAGYYRLRADMPRFDENWTGCGNTLDFGQPRVVRLAIDSLRHWADTYGVDGFRFDLAPVLGRDPVGFSPEAAFFEAVAADPVLSGLKLIAEPWDLGPDGYRLGGFPPGWREWNDRVRDAVRGFWRGDPGQVRGVVQGLAGSREAFAPRPIGSSVNYVVSHDGFTLRDLVSYEHRRNEANGEGNRDGHVHERSCNHGVEGPSDDPAVRAARARHVRALLATVFLAQGVPMLAAGDELSRSQGGNNNPYCQDNETAWLDWETGKALDPDLPGFVAALASTRRAFAALRRADYFAGGPGSEGRPPDVRWLHPHGRDMEAGDWEDGELRSFGMAFGDDAPDGRRLLLLAHAGPLDLAFRLPAELEGPWRLVLDTERPEGALGTGPNVMDASGTITMASRSLRLFEAVE